MTQALRDKRTKAWRRWLLLASAAAALVYVVQRASDLRPVPAPVRHQQKPAVTQRTEPLRSEMKDSRGPIPARNPPTPVSATKSEPPQTQTQEPRSTARAPKPMSVLIVEGTVVNPDGTAAGDTLVSGAPFFKGFVIFRPARAARTDSSGAFRLAWPVDSEWLGHMPFSVTMNASSKQGRAHETVEVKGIGTVAVHLRLEAIPDPVVLSGRVVKAGSSVPGVKVEIGVPFPSKVWGGTNSRFTYSATTNENGGFQIRTREAKLKAVDGAIRVKVTRAPLTLIETQVALEDLRKGTAIIDVGASKFIQVTIRIKRPAADATSIWLCIYDARGGVVHQDIIRTDTTQASFPAEGTYRIAVRAGPLKATQEFQVDRQTDSIVVDQFK